MARRRGTRFAVSVLAAIPALMVGLVVAPSAAAETLPPNLNGQVMESYDTWGFAERMASQCDSNGPTTFSFTTSGKTGGPYPGTFTEQVTAVVAPHPEGGEVSVYGVPVPAYRTISVHATFTIDSSAGTVTGTKDLVVDGGRTATCGSATGTATYNNQTSDATVVAASFGGRLTYTATIETGDGTYSDTGTSDVFFMNYGMRNASVISETDGFWEYFYSTQPVVPLGPASVALTPADAVDTVGTSHAVTATVENSAGNPVSGTDVLFTVAGSVSATGSCITDGGGQCSFDYQGPYLPGADEITACADADGNGAVDAGEPCSTATKAWVLPETTPGEATGGGQTMNAGGSGPISFGFNARSADTGLTGHCSLVDSSADTVVKCLDVIALTRAGNVATFFGAGTIDGASTMYRIDVVDNHEPGSADTFQIRTSSGYSAGGVLTGGNVQVR